MRCPAAALVALAFVALAAPPANAATPAGPEALDSRFGSCGVSQARVPSDTSTAQRVAIAADGSAVIAGTAGRIGGDDDRFVLQRLRADGSVDRSFADGGVRVVGLPSVQGQGSSDVALTGLAISADGKIVVSGFARDVIELGDTTAVLARFNVDGTPDGSFGSGGFVVDRLGGTAVQLADVAIAPDGRILAAGVRSTARLDDPDGSPSNLVVARFQPDGARDASFGSNGVAAPVLGDLQPTRANAIRLLADGRILVAGQADEQFALARLSTTGELDPSFATGGFNAISPPASSSLSTIEVDGQGRIVAAGTATDVNAANQLALARYLPQGTLDLSFGAGGLTVDRRAFDPRALALLPDGRVLATGKSSFRADFRQFGPGPGPGSGLMRYGADGRRDASFGQSGALALVRGSNDQINDVALAPDGTALAAQTLEDTFAVTRFVVGQPALAAIAGLPQICLLAVADKRISRVLDKPKGLLTRLVLTKPGELRVEAVVQVGSSRAKLKATTRRIEQAGSTFVALGMSRSAEKLLRGARSATFRASARATSGGPTTTATRTLGP